MIKTAIIPVAGRGTRMLPATKVVAKELLTVFDRPIIQHVVEEGLAAGIERFIFVANEEKMPVIEHFQVHRALETELRTRGKTAALNALQSTNLSPDALDVVFQNQPLGLGHAILQAEALVEDEHFAVMLPDEVYLGGNPLAELIAFQARFGGAAMAMQSVAPKEVSSYGIAELDVSVIDGGARLRGMVEKPSLETAPSHSALVGRYLFDNRLFEHLARTEPGAGGEIQLTDAVASSLPMIPTYGKTISAQRFDCGSRSGWLAAQTAFAVDALNSSETDRRTVADAA